MKDIPFFTTENGVATLILQEIPNNEKAYICICDSKRPDAFLKECCDFCRAAGAQTIYADGISNSEVYPHYTDILQMQGSVRKIPETQAELVSVDAETIGSWRQLYNDEMKNVPAAFYMSHKRAEEILKKGTGYFVYFHDRLLGIGVVDGNKIECIIALAPGTGKDVFSALCRALRGEDIALEVASENKRAVRFYEKMGFVSTDVKYRWLKVYPTE